MHTKCVPLHTSCPSLSNTNRGTIAGGGPAKFRTKRSYLHKFKENNESRQKLLQTPAELKMAADIAAHSGASGRNDQQVINPQSHDNLHKKIKKLTI